MSPDSRGDQKVTPSALTWLVGYEKPGRSNVRFWHKADMPNALTMFHFWGQSGHGPTAAYQAASQPIELPDYQRVALPERL